MLLCGFCAAAPAQAATQRRYDIAPSRYSDALIDLAIQADVSLLGASACPGFSRAEVKGSFTLEEALRRLLAGSGCGYRLADAWTVRILPPGAPAAPPLRPASPIPAVSELMITANKRGQAAERVAAALSVIPHSQLVATRAADAGDTTGQVAGVMMTNLGPGRDKLLIRGLSDGMFTGRARSTVATYLDDAPVNYNAPDPDLRLTDVERVEVVRGPQGALYGAGALGGVYRIVTRKPELSAPAAGVDAGHAWTEGGAPTRWIEGYANLPLERDRLALRAAAYHEDQGGYLDDVNMRRSDVDRTLRDGARLAARASADGWTLDASAAWQHLQSNDTQYVTQSPADGGRPGRRRANRVAESHENTFAQAAWRLAGQLASADLTVSGAYVRHSFTSQYDASAALDLFRAPAAELGVYSERRRVEMLVQDVVLSSRGPGRFNWLAGIYAASTVERSPSELRAMLWPAAPLSSLYSETRTDRMQELAAYGEVSYEVVPRWTLAAGGRAFGTRLHTNSSVEAPAPGRSRAFEQEQQYSGFSPKLSVQRALAGGGQVYGLFSTGYRAGGANSGGLLPLSPARAAYAPDRLRNFEVGAKLRTPDGRGALQAAGFFDQWRNIQTDQFLLSGLAYTANVGDAAIKGLEAELSYGFDMGLSVKANALFAKSRFTRRNPDFAARLADGLPGTPELSGGVLAIYERPLRHGLRLRLVGAASYVGRSRLTFDAAMAPVMGDYVKADLSAGLVGPYWTADLYVSNPANDAGDTFAYGNPFSFGQVRQVTPQRPRTVGVTASASF